LEKRSLVNEESQFTISQLKDIFTQKEDSESVKNTIFRMHKTARDLIYFTLFISRALKYTDTIQLNQKTDFFSRKNQPVRGLLHLATELGHEYLVEQLIRSSIDVNLVDKTHQTAFDIAVYENLFKIKPILLKRSDIVPNQHDVDLKEHPLRICILDNDEASARIVLENNHFKTWIESQLISNRANLGNEFSKLLFDVFMVFQDEYKSSIFIMHDLVQNCGASLNFY